MLRCLPLLLIYLVIFFPTGWLIEHWLRSGENLWLSRFFYSEKAHTLAHTIIFLGSGLVLLMTFPGLQRRFLLYLSLILLAGLLQEGFQLLYKRRGVAWNDLFDLTVDMSAGLVAWVLLWFWNAYIYKPRRS
ncbi:MAG: hypothetical protein HC837_07875 [Chloroflexaceae bacterium]|nr:hypothetical protein [Chloroflexaceae bacterium]